MALQIRAMVLAKSNRRAVGKVVKTSKAKAYTP